jgi:hypothetical protein
VVLSAGSDDYIDGITAPMVPLKFKVNSIIRKIIINKHRIAEAN